MACASEAILSDIVRRLVDEFHPEKIYLFGFHAWGTPSEDSDLDILVIVPESDETPVKRAQRAQGLMWGVPVPMDIFIQTRAEFQRYINVIASLAHSVEREGKVLYG